MAFYALTCGIFIILLSTKLVLINEEAFILVSFSLFFFYILKNFSPQVSELIDNQITKVESIVESNFVSVKNDYLSLEKVSSNLLLKAQILNLQSVIINNIKQVFKHKAYNVLSDLKNTKVASFQLIQNLENSIYKLIYITIYVEVSNMMLSKQYWLLNFNEKTSLSKLNIENQELLNKI